MSALQLLDSSDPRVEQIWRDLEGASRPGYRASWGWIASWLAAYPHREAPRLAVIGDRDRPMAACFAREAGHVLELGTAILRRPDSDVTLASFVDALPPTWDALVVPRVDRTDEAIFTHLDRLEQRGFRVRATSATSTPFVDLELVRDASYLSSPARAALCHGTHKLGQLELEVGEDADHALDIFGELLRLDARAALRRCTRGTFADPSTERRLRHLIESRVPRGELELVRIHAGDAVLGCLFNLVHSDHVIAHRSAFAPTDDPRLEAAVLCHAAAIDRYASAGFARYELADDARRARVLATGELRKVRLSVERRLDLLTRCRHGIDRWRAHLALDVLSPA